jgi:hypothetical protein
MEITFTRSGERYCKTVAVRDDGVTVQVPCFDRPAWMPHDIVHYVVERGLGLEHGFWGRVAAGAIFPGMTVLEGRQPPHAAIKSHAAIQGFGQYGTEAEVLVGMLLEIARQKLDTNLQVAHAQVRKAWQAGQSAREPLRAEEVRQICCELRVMQQEWQALADGESLTVSWSRSVSRRQGNSKTGKNGRKRR